MARHHVPLYGAYGFIVAGLLVAILTLAKASAVYEAWCVFYASVEWSRVPVTIRTLSLEYVHGAGPRSGGGYVLQCSYAYEFDGKTYEGSRLGAEDELGADREEVHRRHALLEACKSEGRPFEGLVNPEDPRQAILFRSVALSYYLWPPFLALFFVLACLAFVSGIWLVRRDGLRSKLLEGDPDRPWLAEPDWNTFEQSAGTIGTLVAAWIGALLLVCGLWPFTAFFVYTSGGDATAVLLGLLFFVIPFGWLRTCLAMTARYKRYGIPRLRYASLPIVLGNPFFAVLVMAPALRPDDGFHLRMCCVDLEDARRDREARMLWSETVRVEPAFELAFTFDVPPKLPPCDHLGKDVSWCLEVRATVGGEEFACRFDDLPVYRVKDEKLISRRG